jgi:asparagine synthetase B (glutamine-hydrolysing)
VALGYCLGARTPYAAVRVVEPAQMVEFQHGQRSASYYFDWSGIEPFRGTQKEFARALHRAFLDGVACRASGEDASVAYLSGGLDSRCLTAALLTLGKPVSTINYAPAGSQDLVLGRLAAEKLGTRHLEFPRGALDFRDRGVESYLAWQASQAAHDLRPAPMRVWAGFAGETVLAPTNISEAAAVALSKQDLLGAIAAFLARAGTAPSGWLIKPVWRTRLSEELSQSVAAEVERHDIADPHRRFHTFLVLNEPRGMLSRHFEELDERRLRYILPFLDTRFVALALSAPLEWLLRHRFYYRWLDEFQEAVRSVPWQAYPWSLPCPLQVPLGLRRQWDEDWFTAAERREEEERLMARVRCDLRRAAFPSQILNRMAIMAAYGLARIGVRRYLYMLRVARAFVQISADIYE